MHVGRYGLAVRFALALQGRFICARCLHELWWEFGSLAGHHSADAVNKIRNAGDSESIEYLQAHFSVLNDAGVLEYCQVL